MPEQPPMEFPFYECAVDSPDVPRSVYAAVGKAAMAWARLEQHLDAVLLQVNKKRFSESLYREHPGTFIGKVRLLKDWFNKHPARLFFVRTPGIVQTGWIACRSSSRFARLATSPIRCAVTAANRNKM